MSLMTIALLGIIIMLCCVLLGVNIGLSMAVVGFFGYSAVRNFPAAIAILGQYSVSSSMTYTMTVIPLFVLMGNFAFHSGISDDLFLSSRIWFGRIKGSIAYAAIMACALFGAICGSLAATTATMSKVAKPIMSEHKYKDEVIGGTLACGGTLGVLIPPSTIFIIYGVMTEVSIGKLFAAGVMPGIVMAICFCGVIVLWTKKDKDACPAGRSYSMKEKAISLKGFVGMFIVFFIVLGGMFSGTVSVTEAAALGALVTFVIMFIRRRITGFTLKESFLETIVTTGMVMLNIVGANIFGNFMSVTNLPINLANGIMAMNMSPIMVIVIIIVIYGVLGCIMDILALVILSLPIFMPIIDILGFDKVWFGVLIVMITNLGSITPPVGLSCYVASGVMEMPLGKVFRGAVPFLMAFAVSFALICAFPGISLWLPGLVVG